MNQSRPPRKERINKFESNRKYFTICVYAVITFMICLAIFKLTNNWAATKKQIGSILSVLSPFLIAFLIAYFVTPVIRFVDRLLFSKANPKYERIHLLISMVLSYIIIIGGIVLLFIFGVPQIISSISQLIRQSTDMYASILNATQSLNDKFPGVDLSFLEATTQNIIPDIITYMRTFMSDIVLPFLYNAGLSIISWFINILLAFVISCYILFSKTKLIFIFKRLIYAMFNKDTARKLVTTLKECNQIFSSFITGKTLDSIIIGFICLISMNLLKLPYAILISLIVGITNMIPYFGPFIGAIPGILLLLIISPKQSLIFAILILAIQQLDGAVIGPKILGKSTGLQPIAIIFAITVGGALAGPVGMFLGVPITAVICFLLDKFVDYILYKKHIAPDLSNMDEAAEKTVPVNKDFEKEFQNLPYDEEDSKKTTKPKQ